MFDTFEAFRPHFNALARAGYFKIVPKPTTKWKYTLHYYYRVIVWVGVVTYNIQLLILSIQVNYILWMTSSNLTTEKLLRLKGVLIRLSNYRLLEKIGDRHKQDMLYEKPTQVFSTLHCTKQLLETLFVLLTTLNTLGKQIAFNVRVRRIDNIIDVINGISFAPKNSVHDAIAKANAVSMSRLLSIYHVAVNICGGLFTIYPLINRALGLEAHVSGYFPFDTNEAPIFHIAVIYMGVLISLQAYGHVTMDCTIVAFYAQAKTQLQIFRYDIEHFVDEFESESSTTDSFQYVDDNENNKRLLQKKFLSSMNHYQDIVWFAKEIESIFGEAMIVQFFVMAWVICMTTYKIVGLSIMSAEFVSIVLYLGCMLAQLFLYCYYGTFLNIESELVNDSVYQSGWQSLSPAFRRQVFVLMERCKRTVEPRTAYVIPMSLDTYISVLRSSYALFTILDRK